MRVPLRSFVLASALLTAPLTTAVDIPSDVPVSSLLASAKRHLAQGAHNDALSFYDAAIKRDPSNYLSIFQRGAAYLALGRDVQATADFDKVLELKPGFEAALVQRAKTKARKANWTAAKGDYVAAGKKDGPEMAELEEAQGAAFLADEAANKGEWETCISQSGVAILVAGTALPLRQLRARCRFEHGDIQEGISDLAHVLQINPGQTEPHLQMSSMLFYSLGDTDRGIAQITKCLHSDPDSKPCSKLRRREKQIAKTLKEIETLMSNRRFNSAAKLLAGTPSDTGLLQDLKDDVAEAQSAGRIHSTAPSTLYARLVETTCEAYREMNSLRKSIPFCTEALALNPESLYGLLSQAQRQLDSEDYEAAITTLNTAKEHHASSNQVSKLLNEAHILLKRSKQKDYYKVLGVSRDADDQTIKKNYRLLVRQNHPDKAAAKGISKEDAEKKMAQINEAYEVLSNPELRARFDRGDDPNDQESQHQHPFHGSPFGGPRQAPTKAS